MLNALGRVLLIWIWKLADQIECYLIMQTDGKPEYKPGYLRLGLRQTLNYFKKFDEGAREYLLATMPEGDDQREQTIEWLSKILASSTDVLHRSHIVVAQAHEKYEDTKYWFTSCTLFFIG